MPALPALLAHLVLLLLLLLRPAAATFVLSRQQPAAPATAALGDAAAPPPPQLRALSAAAATPFAYPTLEQVESRVAALAAAHPSLVRTWTAQQAYGTPAGQCHDAQRGAATICRHTFVKLTNFTSGSAPAAAAQSRALLDRPQLFFSGNLHGDEWVGPVTLLAVVEMLLACGADARAQCFSPWLARLLNTRTMVFLIVSNPAGYSHPGGPTRAGDGPDPNRDFAYATNSCLKSSTAQAINSAWREHVFQLAVTFHGGMESITYEWGSPAQQQGRTESPDDAAQAAVCGVMRDAAGTFEQHDYVVGRTNDVVYAVEGGMEDWAYAGAARGRARGKGAQEGASVSHTPPPHPRPSPHARRLLGPREEHLHWPRERVHLRGRHAARREHPGGG